MVTRADAYTLYKDEYLYVDATETVTVRHDELEQEDTVVTAKRAELSALAASFDPMDIEETDQPWIIYADTLSFTPHKGAVIIDSQGVEYPIKSFVRFRWDTQYHCICSRVPTGAC